MCCSASLFASHGVELSIPNLALRRLPAASRPASQLASQPGRAAGRQAGRQPAEQETCRQAGSQAGRAAGRQAGGQDFKANRAKKLASRSKKTFWRKNTKFSTKSLLGVFCKNLAKILLELVAQKNTIRSKKLGLIAQETQRYRAKNSQL